MQTEVYKRMSSTVFGAVLLLTCALTFSAAQTRCKGRCGLGFSRNFMCQCDYNCLLYDECCKDYESQCTTKNSCKGRCGETFKRGRKCSCDAECMKFKQCCSDYDNHCETEEPTPDPASTFSEGDNDDDHYIPEVSPTSYLQDDVIDDMYVQIFPNDESKGAEEDPEKSPVPESTSGYGSSTADLGGQTSAGPTQHPDAQEISTEAITVSSQEETNSSNYTTTEVDHSLTTLNPISGVTPTESTDSGTTLPQPTAAADPISSQPAVTPLNQSGNFPTTSIPELGTVGSPADDVTPEFQDISEVTTAASYPPLASASTEQTQSSTAVLENTQVTTVAPTSTLVSTPNPEDVTPPPLLDAISGSSTGSGSFTETDAVTTHIPHTLSATVGTDDALGATTDQTGPTPAEVTSKPQDTLVPYKPTPTIPPVAKPSSKPETKPVGTAQPVSIDNTGDYQSDDSNYTNLCSGRPVSAATTLSNGTVVVFREHVFWFLDRNRVPGPAQSITRVWGVPSPIDTVFTRCNCQGKTYIFKGDHYWRYENAILDAGYPKLIQTGFDGLRGQITAALSVPQYRMRKESVYFFKRGGLVQKYSYQFGTSGTCGRRVQYAVQYAVHTRRIRQIASLLGPVINIRTSWRGFPSTITAAVSIPSNREPEGYKYYVFSRSKSYNVRIDGERPVINAPASDVTPQSHVFKCPQNV
ncbi:proteoglycan 4b [Antennarius striatus]|uniref:proteoglycan 4b n=1 Tax=Antennarius striatus TaxID=241820 RepID=UPI0035B0B2C7